MVDYKETFVDNGSNASLSLSVDIQALNIY